MKSPAELKHAHDLLLAAISGHLPIQFRKQDLRVLEGQYHVLCWFNGCDSDCFKNSMESIEGLLKQIHTLNFGRKFRSRALVE